MYIKTFEKFNNNYVIAYHRSNYYDHMMNSEFDFEKSDSEFSIFGQAIYFSESPSTSVYLGKYLCKFKIRLKEPTLDMNSEINNDDAYSLLNEFNKRYNHNIQIDFDESYNNVLLGEFFLELNDLGYNNHFKDFITNKMGYNSFKYYSTYDTDFRETIGDYGLSYGIYDVNDIEFMDGPF